ncbi:MAG: glycosyl hydrolase family 18,F5/8 type C domain-containing protein [Sphingobacteriales bacterium]|jgi:hypothetical protein|nr:glycosyl hydrolase family 18,F5/8 type C domain-containing protein [Sphingobacteriales bacterium]
MNKLFYLIGVFLFLCIPSCTKQNLPESKVVPTELNRSDDYFANLRAYKKSDHPIFFGWFGGTGSMGNPEVPGVMDQIPDSVDIVALWGGAPPIGSYNFETMQKTRELKGTRFVITIFGSGVEKLMKKNDSTLYVNDVMAAIDKVAKSISDTIDKYQIDGFDLDYEPSFGDNSIFGDSGGYATNDPHTQRLFKALSQYLGPKSGTGKLLIIDGQSDIGIEPYIDYFMQQAYGSSSPSNLQSRLTTYGGGVIPARKFVPCENFESYWANGGVNFNDPVRGVMPSLLGFAYWNPVSGRKGGCGTYHAEYEYALTPDYNYARRAIQIMNPAAK